MQEIKPLVSDYFAEAIASQAQQQPAMRDAGRSHLIWTVKHVRDLYEADRAASRLLIEKLNNNLLEAAGLANEAALASLHPGTQLNIDKVNELLDKFTTTAKEAIAFLKP